MKKITVGLLLLILTVRLYPQGSTYVSGQIFTVGTALPATCTVPNIYILSSGAIGVYLCTATNVWSALSTSSVPSGLVALIVSGTCPTGYTEVSSLDAKSLLGTLNSHSDVGNTGGNDNITPAGTFTGNSVTSSADSAGTPAGTNSALTFTGSSATTSAVTAGTPAGTNAATATTGNCAATNVAIGTGAASACKATAPNLTVPAEVFTGSALGTHTHTVTATGTINTPTFTGNALGTHTHTTTATGTFAGNSFDNRSAYKKVIFCSKD